MYVYIGWNTCVCVMLFTFRHLCFYLIYIFYKAFFPTKLRDLLIVHEKGSSHVSSPSVTSIRVSQQYLLHICFVYAFYVYYICFQINVFEFEFEFFTLAFFTQIRNCEHRSENIIILNFQIYQLHNDIWLIASVTVHFQQWIFSYFLINLISLRPLHVTDVD